MGVARNQKNSQNSAEKVSKENLKNPAPKKPAANKKAILKESQNQSTAEKDSTKKKKASVKVVPDLSNKKGMAATKTSAAAETKTEKESAVSKGSAMETEQRGKKRGRPSVSGTEHKKPKLLQGPTKVTCPPTARTVSHPSHLSTGGVVLTIGEGDTGQLGLGPDVMEKTKPGKVELPSKVIQVCAGGMHTVCVTDDGKVYSWGCNDEGALGRKTGDEDECMEPGRVDLPDTVIQVSAGDSHSAALTKQGTVYAWGTFRDANGSIGLTTAGKSELPIQMAPGLRVSRIVSGSDHLACLTVDGELYTMGNGEQGQLGRVAECFSNRGGRKGLGLLLSPAQVHVKKRSTKFDNVWTGSYVTYAHTTAGDVYAWGLNNYYQLGFSDITNRYVPECAKSFSNKLDWKEMAGGQHHTIALDGKGVVYTLGRKEYGRLGLGENVEEKSAPTEVKSLSGQKCVNVACGTAVSYAVTEKGAVYAWGMGTSRQLGQTEEDDCWVPVQINGKQLENRNCVQVTSGGQHTVLLASDK